MNKVKKIVIDFLTDSVEFVKTTLRGKAVLVFSALLLPMWGIVQSVITFALLKWLTRDGFVYTGKRGLATIAVTGFYGFWTVIAIIGTLLGN